MELDRHRYTPCFSFDLPERLTAVVASSEELTTEKRSFIEMSKKLQKHRCLICIAPGVQIFVQGSVHIELDPIATRYRCSSQSVNELGN